MSKGRGWRSLWALAPMLELGLLAALVAYGAAVIAPPPPAPAAWCDWNRVFPEPDLYYCDGPAGRVLVMPPYDPGYGKPTITWAAP